MEIHPTHLIAREDLAVRAFEGFPRLIVEAVMAAKRAELSALLESSAPGFNAGDYLVYELRGLQRVLDGNRAKQAV